MTLPANRLACFGLGYSAEVLAMRLAAEGWSIAGTTRDPAKATRLRALGFDIVTPDDGSALLAGATHLLVSVAPDEAGDPGLATLGPLIREGSTLRWIGYLSATSVYGDRNGAWVDETATPHPIGERGRRRVEAEQDWLALGQAAGIAAQVFRLAGIYGPGRSALDTVRASRAQRVVKPGLAFSRIHVDDIAQVLAAAIAAPRAGAIYNVADDSPTPPDEVIGFACELLGVPAPRPIAFEDATLSPIGRSFYLENKRVSNGLLKSELGVTLRYPDYRAGLQALLAGEKY